MKKKFVILILFFLGLDKSTKAQLWIEQITNESNPLLQITFVDSLHGWANPSYYTITSSFHLIATKNGGKTWERINYTPQNEQFREIQFIDSLIGYARGHSKIYKTFNGGYSWNEILEKYPSTNQYSSSSTSISFLNKNFGIASYYLKSFKTTDGGNSWTEIFNGNTGNLNKVYFLNENSGWLSDASLFRTNDGGSSWLRMAKNCIPLYFSNTMNGYGTMKKYYEGIYKTTDGGNTWGKIFDGNYGDSPRYQFKGNLCFVCPDMRGNILRTTDDGKTWDTIKNDIYDFVVQSLAFTDKENLWLAGWNGKIFKLNIEPIIELKNLINMETLFIGDEFNILWNCYNIPSNDLCKIQLTQDDGITWNTIADSLSTVKGIYTWKLNNTLITSTKCRIRIISYSTNAKSQNTDFFSICTRGHINVNKVSNSSSYMFGSKLKITWKADYISNSKVTIEILTTPDTLNTKTSKYDSYETGVYLNEEQTTIAIPDVTLYCKIRIRDSDTPSIYGETNYFRSRQLPKLFPISSPSPKQICQADSIRQISFNHINIKSVDISISSDSGSTWAKINSLVIADSIGEHITNFAWGVPRINSDCCILKIQSTDPIGLPPFYTGYFTITQDTLLGTFPLAKNNKWFYKTHGRRYPDLYGCGTSYSYPNIYYIIITEEEKLLNDNIKYYPFAIYQWDENSGDLKNFLYVDTKYYRKSGNQIYTYGSNTPWLDFEHPYGNEFVFGSKYRTYIHGYEGNVWDLVANEIGIVQPFSYSINMQCSPCQINNIAGAIINGVTYGEVVTDFITSADETKTLFPQQITLSQNYPNPFNPTTTIKFSIPNSQLTTLKVYDVLGREIAKLVDEVKTPGNYEVKFNGGNLSSGIYFYRLNAGSFSAAKKLILMK